MRPVLLLLVGLLLSTSGCSLRPRYRDFVTAKTEARQVQLRLTDGAGAPLANARVELSEWKNRLQLTTAADGTFTLPVEKKYLDENPVLVVQVPQGVPAYQVLPWAPPPPAAVEPAAVEPAVTPPAVAPPAAPTPSGTTP
ncbi:MAG: hypothetical protein INH41_04275 [Myxococcaceae bacterium]|jgi:hypothetical protein|nr:hypothetical protein [Myxococcaceae bacterium]MCA3011599.1 hypothetical protein [Myxococcaceae bacterium]